MQSPAHPHRVVVVGGGASGVLVAAALLRTGAPVQVTIVEPREQLGEGVAYSTRDEGHLLNVPAARISAIADEPADFVRWIAEQHPEAGVVDATFAPRGWYAHYLRDVLARARGERPDAVRHVRARATAVAVDEGTGVWHVRCDDGARLDADDVVLALGNVDAPPAVELPEDPRVFEDPWQPGALDGSPARVLLIGTGLTAVDAALSLGRDPAVHVTACSRSGRLPAAHLPGELRSPADIRALLAFARQDGLGLDELVGAVEGRLRIASASTHEDWRDVVDALRPHVTELWRALDTQAQARFIRVHMRAWETRRHRMAPDVAERIATAIDAGRLEICAARLVSVRPGLDGVHVTTDGAVGRGTTVVDRVISCTGPVSDITTTRDELLRGLLDAGTVAPDVHRLGLTADEHGEVQPGMYVLGTLRRGELWETTAIPELRTQASALSTRLTGSPA